MTAKIIPFVPRNVTNGKPMLEQLAHEIIEQITVPRCHDDLTGEGGCVLDAMMDGDRPA